MLFGRGRRLSLPSSKQEDEGCEPDDMVSEVSGPVRTSTPVYPADPTRYCQEVFPKQGPKQVRDRLIEMMRDERYHSAGEMEVEISGGEWVRGMRELIDRGYWFDRRGNSFKIRYRLKDEPKQVLVRLLAGVDATVTATVEVESSREDDGVDQVSLDRELGCDVGLGEGASVGDMKVAVSDGDLPLVAADFVGGTHAILAKKGYGKSYLAMVLVEEVCRVVRDASVVVVDPMGVWAPGLRAMADGSPSSFSCVTYGGLHADVRVTSSQGAIVADSVLASWPAPSVVDLSAMSPREQHQLVADMVERLFVRADRRSVHLVVDESDEFAPQQLTSSQHQKRSLEALDRLVRRGRTKGLGSTMITQRPAVINKHLLTQVDALFLLHLIAPPDLQAADEWLKFVVQPEQRADCLRQLPALPVGHAFFLRGGSDPLFARFVTRRRQSFDSSRTPRPGESVVVPTLSRPGEELLERVLGIFGCGVGVGGGIEEV